MLHAKIQLLFKQWIFFKKKKLNIRHSTATILWTTQSYSINKLRESLESFPEFSVSATIFLEISLIF